MGTQFKASIVLDAEKATNQARAFGKAVTNSSKTLQNFQKIVEKTAQGGASNVFIKYEKSIMRLDTNMRDAVAGLHSMKNGMTDVARELAKLTAKGEKATEAERKRAKVLGEVNDRQQEALVTMGNLNRKYDENARAVKRLKTTRNELNLIVASGLKTKKEALAIFKKEAKVIRESTTAYKLRRTEEEKAIRLKKEEADTVKRLLLKYDSELRKKEKLKRITSELNLLVSKGRITKEKMISLYNREAAALNKVNVAGKKVSKTHSMMSELARKVSVATRLMLGAYIALSAVKSYINIAKTADAIQLLDQKLRYFTGDGGAYKKLFNMTQEIGISMKEAGRIITRFAVVTKGAFSMDTMTEWAATLTKSARAAGTSTQEMTGALIQITQAMSAGRLMGDEYRSVTENLPLLTVALRDIFKGTSLSLKELSSKGLLTTDVLIEAFGRLKDTVALIPGTTDTVEARIGALTSAWENFTTKISNTEFVKDALDFISSSFNAMSATMSDPNSGGERFNRLIDQLKEAKEVAKQTKEQIDAITSNRNSPHLSRDGTEGESAHLTNLRAELSKTNELSEQLKSSISSFYDKSLSKAVEVTKEEQRLLEQREALLKQKAKYGVGFDKQSVIDLADIEKKVLKIQNDARLEREEIYHSEADMKKFFLEINRRTNEEILEGEQKLVDSRLKAQSLSTKANLDFIKNEVKTTKAVLAINNKFNRQKEAIASARQRFVEENRIGTAHQKDSLSKDKAQEAIKLAQAIKSYGLADEMKKINSAIKDLTTSDIADSLSPYQIHLALEAKLQTKRKEDLEDFYDLREKGNRTTGKFLATEAAGLDAINKKADKRIKLLKERFSNKYARLFSKRLVAEKRYTDQLEQLNVAKKSGLLTTYEIIEAEQDLIRTRQNSIESAAAAVGALTGFDAAYKGMLRGLRDFSDKVGDVYSIMSKHTESFLTKSTDAFGQMVANGKLSFETIGDMFKKTIKDMIAELVSLAAKDFIINLTGQGTSTVSTAGGTLGNILNSGGGNILDNISGLGTKAFDLFSGSSGAGGVAAYTSGGGSLSYTSGLQNAGLPVTDQLAGYTSTISTGGLQVADTLGSGVGTVTQAGDVGFVQSMTDGFANLTDSFSAGFGVLKTTLITYAAKEGLKYAGDALYGKDTTQSTVFQVMPSLDLIFPGLNGLVSKGLDKLFGWGPKAPPKTTINPTVMTEKEWDATGFGRARQLYDSDTYGITESELGNYSIATQHDAFSGSGQKGVDQMFEGMDAISASEAILASAIGENTAQSIKEKTESQPHRITESAFGLNGYIRDRTELIYNEIGGAFDVIFDSLSDGMDNKDFMKNVIDFNMSIALIASNINDQAGVFADSINVTAKGLNGDTGTEFFTEFLKDIQEDGDSLLDTYTKVTSATLAFNSVLKGLDEEFTGSYIELARASSALFKVLALEGEEFTQTVERIVSQTALLNSAFVNLDESFEGTAIDLAVLADELFTSLVTEGESAAETLDRVSNSFAIYMDAINMMNIELGLTTVEFITAASQLSEITGGVENMQNLWGTYFSTFYTEIDKAEYELRKGQQLLEAYLEKTGLNELGLTIDNFRAQFEAALASGMTALQTKVWLDVGSMLAANNKKQEDLTNATSSSTTVVEKKGRQLYNVEPASQRRAVKVVTLEERQKPFVDAISDLKSKISLIDDTLIKFTGRAAEIALHTKSQGVLLEMASSGVIPSMTDLKDAVKNIGTPDASLFSSALDFDKDKLVTANALSTIKDGMVAELTIQEQMLEQLTLIAGMSRWERYRYEQEYGSIPGFASGGSHSGGLRIVGEAGPELEYTGSSNITSNSDLRDLLNFDELLHEIRQLRSDVKVGNYAIAKNTLKTSKVLNKFDKDGMPAERIL